MFNKSCYPHIVNVTFLDSANSVGSWYNFRFKIRLIKVVNKPLKVLGFICRITTVKHIYFPMDLFWNIFLQYAVLLMR